MEGSLWNCVTLQPFAPWLPRSTLPKRQPCSDALIGMEVKPLFSLLAAKAAIVNQLHGLSVCFASFHMVTPLREHFLMFPRFGNALDILSEYCEERYEEALAAYRQASECSASEPSSYEKQAQVLEKWASKLRKRAMGLRS